MKRNTFALAATVAFLSVLCVSSVSAAPAGRNVRYETINLTHAYQLKYQSATLGPDYWVYSGTELAEKPGGTAFCSDAFLFNPDPDDKTTYYSFIALPMNECTDLKSLKLYKLSDDSSDRSEIPVQFYAAQNGVPCAIHFQFPTTPRPGGLSVTAPQAGRYRLEGLYNGKRSRKYFDLVAVTDCYTLYKRN